MRDQIGDFYVWLGTTTLPDMPIVGRVRGWVKLVVAHREKGSAAADGLGAGDGPSAEELNSLAWEIHEAQVAPETAERLAAASLALDPENPFTAHTILAIRVRQQRWADVWPPLKTWLAHVSEYVVEDRWPLYYLPIFREVVRARQAVPAAEVLKECGRDELWLPLHHALLAASGDGEEAIVALPEALRERGRLLYHQLRVEAATELDSASWPTMG